MWLYSEIFLFSDVCLGFFPNPAFTNAVPQSKRLILRCNSGSAVRMKRQRKKSGTGKARSCQASNGTVVLIRSVVWRSRTDEWQHSTVSAKHLFFTLNVAKWNHEWTYGWFHWNLLSLPLILNRVSTVNDPHYIFPLPSQRRSEQRSICASFHLAVLFWDLVVILILDSSLNAERESDAQ